MKIAGLNIHFKSNDGLIFIFKINFAWRNKGVVKNDFQLIRC
jgi:hypothetical protein